MENVQNHANSCLNIELNLLAAENRRNSPTLPQVVRDALENLNEVYKEKSIF